MGKKEELTRKELRTIFNEFYVPAIRRVLREEVVKERGEYEAKINERLGAIEAELGIEFSPESKEFDHYLQFNISPFERTTIYKTIPQSIERPAISITDKMKALLKHLGIKEITKMHYPAKTEIKVIKKGLPLRSNK